MIILLFQYVLQLNYTLKHFILQFPLPPYLKCPYEQCTRFKLPNLSRIASVLLIFHISIAIPIPELQYCVAIQNSKTCSSLSYRNKPPKFVCNYFRPGHGLQNSAYCGHHHQHCLGYQFIELPTGIQSFLNLWPEFNAILIPPYLSTLLQASTLFLGRTMDLNMTQQGNLI